ncbi:MAG: 4-vinyl reductase [Myxococcales bacterium]|nr:4-vinyl reductase [Myxococcales bacterium]MCB9704182.1 hypothetical protein [Myxococcales bacterium]
MENTADLAALRERLSLVFNKESYRRVIGGKDVIIHCHHYNSRIQRTVEGAAEIDGKALITAVAERVFCEHLGNVLREDDNVATRRAMAELLYAHLGYGRIDLSRLAEDEVLAPSSHFVEGWLAGLGRRDAAVCSFTEGYLQGAIFAISGELTHVHEVECMATGAERCRFEVRRGRERPIEPIERAPFAFEPPAAEGFLHSESVDEQAIIDAVVGMPIHGNQDGLIPAFGVYLANTPADFYNLLSISFIEEMAAKGREKTARRLLIEDAETCGMNTFRGIMNSTEWEGLIAPMIHERPDNLHALVAVSNALGWGNWHIRQHTPGLGLVIESLNGYEALGFRELRGPTKRPQCCMLTGVAAGMMELVYGEGTLAERFGTFASTESACICSGGQSCTFGVERVA